MLDGKLLLLYATPKLPPRVMRICRDPSNFAFLALKASATPRYATSVHADNAADEYSPILNPTICRKYHFKRSVPSNMLSSLPMGALCLSCYWVPSNRGDIIYLCFLHKEASQGHGIYGLDEPVGARGKTSTTIECLVGARCEGSII